MRIRVSGVGPVPATASLVASPAWREMWEGHRLHLGCGGHRLPPPWLNLDGIDGPAVDVVANFSELGLVPPGSLQSIYWSHGPEHVAPDLLPRLLSTLRERLRSGGELLVATIDLVKIYESRYLRGEDGGHWNAALYGECDSTHDPRLAHRQCFTGETLRAALAAAGLREVVPWAMSDRPELAALRDYASTCERVTCFARGVAP